MSRTVLLEVIWGFATDDTFHDFLYASQVDSAQTKLWGRHTEVDIKKPIFDTTKKKNLNIYPERW